MLFIIIILNMGYPTLISYQGKIMIDIKGWTTVFTNGDYEDIVSEAMVVCKNLRPIGGKLVKTFGMGIKQSSALAENISSFGTYIHDTLAQDKLYIGVYVNTGSNNAITVYAQTGAAVNTAWVNINDILANSIPASYHNNVNNPIIQDSEILRLLPGAVSAYSTNECKGIWIGYLDKDFFAGHYAVSGSDWTAGFWAYNTPCPAPATSIFTFTQLDDGPFNPNDLATENTKYYKFTYVYDGTQESVFSDAKAMIFEQDTFLRMDWLETWATMSKRISGLNIYRSDSAAAGYELIQSINYTRAAATILDGATGA